MAKVSICIPAYNNAESVKRLLGSIEEQTYRDYEVVVTDDSDDDGLRELVDGVYVKNPRPLGAAANWNEAIGRSGGEYVKLMHHDDWFAGPDSLGKLVRMLDEHPEADMAFCGTWQVPLGEEGGGPAEGRYSRHISAGDAALLREDWRNLFLGNTIGSPSAVIHRRKAFGYDTALTWLVDMEFYLHLMRENPLFVHTEEPLVCIGMSGGQLTRRCIEDREINLREYTHIYRKYHLEAEERYRLRQLKVLVDNKGGARLAAECGIGAGEYYRAVAEKKMRDAVELAGVAVRKVRGGN